MGYSEKVLAHFQSPRNVGYIEDPDGVGQLGEASCGDVFRMEILVQRGRIVDIKYLVQGCGAAIAACSAASELVKGMSLEDAMQVTDADVEKELGGLPPEKRHCSNLAATVLHLAIEDYRRRTRPNLQDWRSLYQRRR